MPRYQQPPSYSIRIRMRCVYFSFFALAPLTFAVPRSVFCRFLRCLPVCFVSIPCPPTGRKQGRTLLSAGTLGLGGHADPDEAVLGLELLQGLGGVVDEGEAGRLAATELGAQAEDLDLVLLGLVHAAELLAELILGDVGARGVEDVTASVSPCSSSSNRPASSFPARSIDTRSVAEHIASKKTPLLPSFVPAMRRLIESSGAVGRALRACVRAGGGRTHTTICLRPSSGLRMNLRVRRVTGLSLSAMVANVSGW